MFRQQYLVVALANLQVPGLVNAIADVPIAEEVALERFGGSIGVHVMERAANKPNALACAL